MKDKTIIELGIAYHMLAFIMIAFVMFLRIIEISPLLAAFQVLALIFISVSGTWSWLIYAEEYLND